MANTFLVKPNIAIPDNEVEVGDIKAVDFKPHVKLKKWGDECWIKVWRDTTAKIIPTIEGDKIKWRDGDEEIHFYPLGERTIIDGGREWKQLVDGGFEIEVILHKKPASNQIVMNMEAKGLKFYYQPPLSQKDIDGGSFRPENIIGSYAVYHESKKNNKYKAGKAFHIYRPRAIDANGWGVWSEQEIILDENGLGQQIITIPQDFIDKAVYPIRHTIGDTFGYGGEGQSIQALNSASIHFDNATGVASTGNSIAAYMGAGSSSGSNCQYKLYDASLNQVTNGICDEETNVASTAWFTKNFTTEPTLTVQTYHMANWSDAAGGKSGNLAFHYDTTGDDAWYDLYSGYNSWPASIVKDYTYTDRVYSIYVNYTVGGGSTYRRRIIIGGKKLFKALIIIPLLALMGCTAKIKQEPPQEQVSKQLYQGNEMMLGGENQEMEDIRTGRKRLRVQIRQ